MEEKCLLTEKKKRKGREKRKKRNKMGHIILLFIQNEQIHENGIFTISSGYQILYYDNNILQNEENNLSNNNNTNNNDNWKCALLGIPIEMSNEVNLFTFLLLFFSSFSYN